MVNHRRMQLALVALALLGALCTLPALAADAAPAASGFKADLIANIDHVSGQIAELAAAMPDAKWTWRPAPGVRSVSEVYMHIAEANYMFPKILGSTPPAAEPKDLEKITDRAKVMQELKDSTAYLKASIEKMSDADLDKKVKYFGMEGSERSVLLVAMAHLHEHLGQSIAYARMNGVVPPWTAREMQQEQQKKQKPATKPGKMR